MKKRTARIMEIDTEISVEFYDTKEKGIIDQSTECPDNVSFEDLKKFVVIECLVIDSKIQRFEFFDFGHHWRQVVDKIRD